MIHCTTVFIRTQAGNLTHCHAVEAFVKNTGLGFAMPYLYNKTAVWLCARFSHAPLGPAEGDTWSWKQKATIPWAMSKRRLRSAGGCRQCRGAVWALALRRCSQVV